MASIATDPKGNRTIQFVGGDGKRRSIRLGNVPKRAAEAVKGRVEKLASAMTFGHSIDDDTSRWLADRDQKMLDKLAAVGLIPKREAATLKAFTDSYIALRTDAKPNTHVHFDRVRRDLIAFFGADRNLRSITPGEAEEFRLYLTGKRKLAENTARRILGRAKQFFRFALKRRIISENPFGEMKGLTFRENRERDYFVSRKEAEAANGLVSELLKTLKLRPQIGIPTAITGDDAHCSRLGFVKRGLKVWTQFGENWNDPAFVPFMVFGFRTANCQPTALPVHVAPSQC